MKSTCRHALNHDWRKLLMEKEYFIMDRIDEGSFGEVHTVHKQNDTMVYAVKAIKANGFVTDDEYILAEIRSLLQLKHPHIITMFDLVLSENFVCIIMEYASGGNLENYTLQHQSLCAHFLLTAFQQIVSAVTFCHSKFIAHKDINPSNILIFNDQCVKLADFGLAVKCHDATGHLVCCEDYLGQNSYLAPEILQHKPHYGMRVDVWSLGCLLYFMVCGTPPFEGTANSIVEEQLHVGIRLPKTSPRSRTLNDSMFNVVNVLCKIDPMLRITSFEALELWEDLVDKQK